MLTHKWVPTLSIQAVLVTMSGIWIRNMEYDKHHVGMLCQHTSTTERGNGSISLLTGKSCLSLTQRHYGILLKKSSH